MEWRNMCVYNDAKLQWYQWHYCTYITYGLFRTHHSSPSLMQYTGTNLVALKVHLLGQYA